MERIPSVNSPPTITKRFAFRRGKDLLGGSNNKGSWANGCFLLFWRTHLPPANLVHYRPSAMSAAGQTNPWKRTFRHCTRHRMAKPSVMSVNISGCRRCKKQPNGDWRPCGIWNLFNDLIAELPLVSESGKLELIFISD